MIFYRINNDGDDDDDGLHLCLNSICSDLILWGARLEVYAPETLPYDYLSNKIAFYPIFDVFILENFFERHITLLLS